MWFFNKSIKNPKRPITQEEIAKKVRYSVRTVAEIISKARNYNNGAYNLLNSKRKTNVKITRARDTRSND